jgi:uncharacterized cupredoxin-like copper-binding protein
MHRTFGLTAMLALALAIAACGPGGDSGGSTAGGDTAASVTVTTHDTFAFDPKDVSVSAGQTVNLTLDNAGQALEHSYVVMNAGVTDADTLAMTPDGDADKKFFSLTVAPGETASGTFVAPADPGTYVVACLVAGHAAGGMIGTLTVN